MNKFQYEKEKQKQERVQHFLGRKNVETNPFKKDFYSKFYGSNEKPLFSNEDNDCNNEDEDKDPIEEQNEDCSKDIPITITEDINGDEDKDPIEEQYYQKFRERLQIEKKQDKIKEKLYKNNCNSIYEYIQIFYKDLFHIMWKKVSRGQDLVNLEYYTKKQIKFKDYDIRKQGRFDIYVGLFMKEFLFNIDENNKVVFKKEIKNSSDVCEVLRTNGGIHPWELGNDDFSKINEMLNICF